MKALVIDDHPLFRRGMLHILQRIEGDWDTLEAGDCESAQELINDVQEIDLILLDLNLPGMNGSDGLGRFRKLRPDIPIVILSASDDPKIIRRTLDMGAMGFITKSSSDDVMVNALQLVLAGGIYIPNEALQIGSAAVNNPYSKKSFSSLGLTGRQVQVLEYLVRGLSNKEIARDMRLTENTIRGHVSAILKVLDVSNRTEAAYAANERGLKFDG